ncbi:hypothetical protein PTTG_28921 [Puccinia triticina 1-1 BBBD Race 1]|uniref:Uncharacterized protein n=1 Tax=Puccinia triticina (isolate 1-1 / race 1 (BBBD)) TaxID=630390 RepID=A0A180G8V6_PUCT1|nr:hypothetical protein PTTG_28921 [Puccinia triticina 1-1 BBBD Race 1]
MSNRRFTDYFTEVPARGPRRGGLRLSNPGRRLDELDEGLRVIADYCGIESREVTRMLEALDLRIRNLERIEEERAPEERDERGGVGEQMQLDPEPRQTESVGAVGRENYLQPDNIGLVPDVNAQNGVANGETNDIDAPPDYNEPRNPNINPLLALVNRVQSSVASAAVSSLIDHCELFEGIGEENIAQIFSAAGVVRPHPGPDGEEVERTNAIRDRNLVEQVLDGLRPLDWENDDEFRGFFLRLLAADAEVRAGQDREMWERVFEYRRVSIENRGRPRVIMGVDVDLHRFGHRILPARERPFPQNRSDAREALIADHLRAIRNAERTVRRAGRAITLAQEIIEAERTGIANLRREDEEEEPARGVEMVPGREGQTQAELSNAEERVEVVPAEVRVNIEFTGRELIRQDGADGEVERRATQKRTNANYGPSEGSSKRRRR